jgi:hypothetical protein
MADSLSCQPNADSAYYLCHNNKNIKRPSGNAGPAGAFIILRCSDTSVIFSEEIRNGTASWSDKENVKIFYPAGIPKDTRETTWYFNVKTGKKTRQNSKRN